MSKYITPSGKGPNGEKYHKECDITVSVCVKLGLFPTGSIPLKLDPTQHYNLTYNLTYGTYPIALR